MKQVEQNYVFSGSQNSLIYDKTNRSCYICKRKGNPIIAVEECEIRKGMPLLPEGVYRFARCENCSTLYVDSDVTDDYLIELYRNETTEYIEEKFKMENPIAHHRIPEFEKHWKKMMAIKAPKLGDQLLDFGCQTGEFGLIASRNKVTPNGVELSTQYAETCRKVWGDNSSIYPDLSDFSGTMFDYISAFETLEHMCDPIQKLREMKRLLKPNGIIAVTVPSSDYFHFKFWLMRKSFLKSIFQKRLSSYSSFYEKQVLPHTHIYNFSRKSLWMMLENAGFIPHSIELTGWHGKYEQVIDNSMSLLSSLSGQRFNIAPSLFIIALNKI